MPLFAPMIDGTGTTGRMAQWTAAGSIGDAALAKSGAGVLTLAAAGDYTLTVPATGTAALLGTENLFTARQDVRASGSGVAAGLHVPWVSGDALPTISAGSSASGNDQNAVVAQSWSGVGVVGQSFWNAGLSGYSENGVAVAAATTGGLPVDAAFFTGATSDRRQVARWRHASSAGASIGAGFGAHFTVQLSSTTQEREVAYVAYEWTDAADATRTLEHRLLMVRGGTMTEALRVDHGDSATQSNMWLLYDGALVRVEVGAADSGGTGYRLLRIAN